VQILVWRLLMTSLATYPKLSSIAFLDFELQQKESTKTRTGSDTTWRTETANQRGGEWMGADKNSIQEFGLWTRFHSRTSASFSCQVHVATEVLLNLGARPNQQPQHTRSANTHDTAAGSPNRSGRFLKLVRPLLLDLASRRQGKPVRPVWQTG
jgi:hypothetical protein